MVIAALDGALFAAGAAGGLPPPQADRTSATSNTAASHRRVVGILDTIVVSFPRRIGRKTLLIHPSTGIGKFGAGLGLPVLVPRFPGRRTAELQNRRTSQ